MKMSNIKHVDFGNVANSNITKETAAQGPDRCLDLIAYMSGRDTQEMRDKKAQAHFDAKDRF